ncbi:MAG TPA: FAD-dependent oxidoreductase, partial [Ilumatobacteraceae bacterium]
MTSDPDFVRSRSLWLDTLTDDPLVARPPLAGDTSVDVVVIGAGFTGLWTALYLAEADPAMRIAVIEKDVAGFGASGRNGGWCSALLPMSLDHVAARHGRSSAIAMQRAMHHTIDEVLAAAARHGIHCDAAKGGYLRAATAVPHLDRLRADV